jgi:glycine dehydrogenase subunit 2
MAVLNANYMMKRLKGAYEVPFNGKCMHEFVMSAEKLKEEHGVTAMDVAKALLDNGIHPPTVYFPLIVHEALMVEPTETESLDTLDAACDILIKIAQTAKENPEKLHDAPVNTPISRPDEVMAARKPVLRYSFEE